MNFHGRLWAIAVLIAAAFVLSLAPSAKADAIYTLTDTSNGFSWSFEVPAILTSTTTITSFLNTSIDPTKKLFFEGCTSIDSVLIEDPQSTGAVTTSFAGGTCFSTRDFGTITTVGTFVSGTTPLTITSSGVPEPSSMLLLAGGLISFLTLRRKRLT